MSIFNQRDKEKILSEVTDNNKFLLVCSKHGWAYGSKKPPVFNCKECQMVSYVGLISNTPPDKRLEVMEMLEYSVNKLIEAEKNGQINRFELQKKINEMGKKQSVDVTVEKNISIDESKT
jgi:hypothetical protein